MKIIKSKNFDTNLDASRMTRQISDNIQITLEEARDNANEIAPFDTGELRDSAKITMTQNGGEIEWGVPYANRVYHTNRKNPQTTEWAKKDFDRNGDKYLKQMKEGVIK